MGIDLNKVLEGIDAAKKNSIRIKLNVVALKGINDKEIVDIIKWCADNDHDITIIEVMPMGDIGSENRSDSHIYHYQNYVKIYQKLLQCLS